MDNVYGEVDCFYEQNADMENVLEQDNIEKYLRKCAWHGASDVQLRKFWQALAMVFQYMVQEKFFSFDALTVADYQEILYLAEKNHFIHLDEANIMEFFAELKQFYQFLATLGYEDYTERLHMAQASFYNNHQFCMPEHQERDAFYNKLEHLEDIGPEETEELNDLLDQLLNRMSDYFQQPAFTSDLTRSVALYAGPFVEAAKNDEEFWFGFWDYFFFDYHLIDNDETPLQYYYAREKEHLQPSECYILRDLLKARFTVFYIDFVNDDYAQCTNLFTGESIELPCPDYGMVDFKKTILYGHLHICGVMLLNYITSVPATPKLRQRMKDEILKQYDIYKYQQPDASLADFFMRHAAAARHTIHILANFAQLKVVSLKSNVKGRASDPIGVNLALEDTKQKLTVIAGKFHCSLHAICLLLRLYEDFSSLHTMAQTQQNQSVIVAAVLILFSGMNGMDFVRPDQVIASLQTNEEETLTMIDHISKALACEALDPRYLTEEGFVQALYMV